MFKPRANVSVANNAYIYAHTLGLNPILNLEFNDSKYLDSLNKSINYNNAGIT